MITNGLLLNQNNIRILQEIKIKKMQITIDGDSFYYSTYKGSNFIALDKLIQNIEMTSHLFFISIRFNTSIENQNSILNMVKKIVKNKNIKTDSIKLYAAPITNCNHPSCHSMTSEQFEMFRQTFDSIVKKYNKNNGSLPLIRRASFCSAVRKDYCTIGPDGNLYRCECELANSSEIIGNVQDGFFRNEADMKFLELNLPLNCYRCSYLPLCVGGCPADRLIYKKEFDCITFKKHIENKIINELIPRYE